MWYISKFLGKTHYLEKKKNTQKLKAAHPVNYFPGFVGKNTKNCPPSKLFLVNNISSCVMNNGHASEFFNLFCGVRQGCLLSPLLYIICSEILNLTIRNNLEIKGIMVMDAEVIISAYADDTTLYLKDKHSLINKSGLYGGQKCFFSCIIFGAVFLYSIQPISAWDNKTFGLGSKKKVCSALLWHYTFFLWWEWIWVKSPLRTSFSGMLLWFYCLIMCKWAQNTKFWNFHENRTLHFRKNWHFGSKFSRIALFTICGKFCFIGYFKVSSCKDNYMCYLLKKFEHFITSGLTVALIWMFLQSSYSNAWGSTNFSYVRFNGGIQMNVLMSTVDKLLMIKCSNFLRRSSLGLSSHLYTLK